MKSVNAKRIAVIAASVALGLAFAAPVSFGSIPIVNSAGQPVVQIVVGSSAQPSDGVVAANIAAVIGNLAFTSTPVTATVGGTSGLSCAITAPSCTLSNQQVWLGEQGTVTAVGSYSLKAAIGSILNAAVLNYNTLSYTKTPQGSGQYSYPVDSSPFPIVSSPNPVSAYTGGPGISFNQGTPQANTNGGGLTFTQTDVRYVTGGQSYDNIVRFSSAQVPGLLSGSGTYQESEYLWALGFPVFDQASGVNSFAVLDAQGAYQVTFANPPKVFSGSGNSITINHASFEFDGGNWTIFNATLPNSAGPTSANFITGGKLQLASAATPLQTIYVGQNITSGPITVTLQDLSYPNSQGVADAALAVYNNGQLTNETSIVPGTTQQVNSSGTNVYVYVSETFPGLYSYQKWAKVQLFSSVENITNDKVLPGDPNWYASIWWTTNQSTTPGQFSSSYANQNAELYGLVLYQNQSKSVTLTPGSTLALGDAYKLTFAGDSLGTPGSGNSNYDQLTFSTGSSSTVSYTNPATTSAQRVANYTYNSIVPIGFLNQSVYQLVNDTVITEPVNYLDVNSTTPTAFDINAGSSLPSPSGAVSSVSYNLNAYQFTADNALSAEGVANVVASANGGGTLVVLKNTEVVSGNYASSNYPLTVTVSGHEPGTSSVSTQTFSFTSWNNQNVQGFAFGNVSNIQLSYAVPNGISVSVYATTNTLANVTTTNDLLMGTLTYAGNTLLYTVPQYSYDIAPTSTATNVQYTVEGTDLPFTLTSYSVPNSGMQQYFTYNVPEIVLPSSTTATANVVIGLYNSSTFEDGYYLNSTSAYSNAVNYYSSQGQITKAQSGFRTERGSEVLFVGSSDPTTLTYEMAKSVDTLEFLVGPQSSTVSSTTTDYGPYSVGEATNIANVTIAAVNATCAFQSTSSSCTVSGVSNLTATPSVTSADQAIGLNTATVGGTPLAVLDSNADNASTLIVVGSYYVNSVAQQVFTDYPSFASTFGPSSVVVQSFGTNRILVAGYTANQTVQAGNQFIQDLLSASATT